MSTVQERRDELSVIASDLDTIARRLAVLGHEAHTSAYPPVGGSVLGSLAREAYWIDHAHTDVLLALAKIEKLA